MTNELTVLEAQQIVGGLSRPSKMPCYSYSLPESACKRGAKLKNDPTSICSDCYAAKGRYVFDVVQMALHRRLNGIRHPNWVNAMTFLIYHFEQPFFRWHDSGDVQDFEHLEKIYEVCRNTPHVAHWLPTHEWGPDGIVEQYLRSGRQPKPDNLTIRFSADKFNDLGPIEIAKELGVQVSGAGDSFTCPSSLQDNKCGECRTCWNQNVMSVMYKAH